MEESGPARLVEQFNTEMDRLGPFEPGPRLAVAVSGGADSMALALLARDRTLRSSGEVLALIVDHRLRPASAAEADLTISRLAALAIPARKLTLRHLAAGPGMAERAREARYRVLREACVEAGIAHLLLGHHRGDQVETAMMRALSGSGSRGLAGMAALTETPCVRLVRPLLSVEPARLRAFLTERGVAWVEDPSNRDPTAQRARLRAAPGEPGGTRVLAEAVRGAGVFRAERDRAVAGLLAARAVIRPEGHAVLSPGPIDPEALAALLRMIAGARHAPPADRVAELARGPRPATIGGARIMAAGRLGPGWLVVREPRGMAKPVVARTGAVWDGRFRLAAAPPDGVPPLFTRGAVTLGALGTDAAAYRERGRPPSAVLRALPALRFDGRVVAVPHIGVGDMGWIILFDPRNPAASAPFGFG